MSRPFSPEGLALPMQRQAVLCLGLGGGSDAVMACLLARILEQAGAAEAHYGNTRGRFDEHVTHLSPHIGRFDGPLLALDRSPRHGSTEIDRMLPRGPGGSPLVVLLEKDRMQDAPAILAPELDALGYGLIVGVDTGGDVLSRKREHRNRDRVMLRVLAATRAEVQIVVLGIGSDGTRPEVALAEIERLGDGYLGCFPLAPFSAPLEALSQGLDERRTPRILLRALQGEEEALDIPRGAFPRVRRELLVHGFVFRGRAL